MERVMADNGSQSMAGLPFDDADECAIAALDEINPLSITKNVEFAGRIYRKADGRFYFTRPIQGARDDSKPPPKVIGAVNIGTYHTHAGNFQETDETFSPKDMLKANMAKEYSWLETPYQRILRFTPAALCNKDAPTDPIISGNIEVLRNIYVLPTITIYGTPGDECD
jgi:hypothetical protein